MASLPAPMNPKDPKNPTPDQYFYQTTPGGLSAQEAKSISKKNLQKRPKCDMPDTSTSTRSRKDR